MACYDELYSTVRVENVLEALISLRGKGTLKQIEEEILKIYKLPYGRDGLRGKDGISMVKEPLEKMIKKNHSVELKGRTYTLKEEFLDCKHLGDYGDKVRELHEKKIKEILDLYENKKTIDDYVKEELIVRFEKDVSKLFAKEFFGLLGYEIIDDYYYSELSKGHMLIKVPKGKEQEIREELKNYKKIIRNCELNAIVKGARNKRRNKK